jgi:hypothetical protein
MKTIRVEVTQEDISKGVVGNCRRCPLARAIGRLIGQKISVAVSLCYVSFWKGTRRLGPSYLSREAYRFRSEFDCGEKVLPFSFPISIPEEVPLREAS